MHMYMYIYIYIYKHPQLYQSLSDLSMLKCLVNSGTVKPRGPGLGARWASWAPPAVASAELPGWAVRFNEPWKSGWKWGKPVEKGGEFS